MINLINDDCLTVLQTLDTNSVDSIVTDPPYGISFLGNDWDYELPSYAIWEQCLRVLKPGGHLFSFSSARTYHRLAVSIEDAGFEIRDQIMWVYGQGMPKGGNLKPAHEPICIARKPGKGKLNVDECRIPLAEGEVKPWAVGEYSTDTTVGSIRPTMRTPDKHPESRYPANFIHDGIEEKWGRFFYCAKDRTGIKHPTVKPIKLMEYLVRLATQPGGIVVDPFMGSGSTGVAAINQGYQFIGIEKDADYFELAKERVCSTRTL